MIQVYTVSDRYGSYYIGCHSGANRNYVGSGVWPRRMCKEGRRGELLTSKKNVAEFEHMAVAREFEAFLISHVIDDPMCMNISAGGGGPEQLTLSQKDRLSNAIKRKWADPVGVMEAAAKNRHDSPEIRRRKGAGFRGKKRPEHSKRMSLVMSGKAKSKKHRENISAAKRGVSNVKARKRVIIDGVTYGSAKEAEGVLQIPRLLIAQWCREPSLFAKRRKFKNLNICVYA